MEERLLLHWIRLSSGNIAERHHEAAAAVEAHLADSRSALRDRAAVAARETADTVPIKRLVQFPFGCMLLQNLG